MRWGPVVASVVAAFALIAAAFTGITVTTNGADESFGLVALDGLMGETMLVLAVALVGFSVAFALRKLPAPALVALGIVAALSVFVGRASLSSDADSVSEFITSQGTADGIDSALTALVDTSVTAVDVDSAAALLAMSGAAALVVIGWAGFAELGDRRRGSRGAGLHEPIIDSSQVDHT